MEDTSYGNLTCQSCQEKYPKCSVLNGKRKWSHRKFCSKCREGQHVEFKSKISDEDFLKAVKNSFSIHRISLF